MIKSENRRGPIGGSLKEQANCADTPIVPRDNGNVKNDSIIDALSGAKQDREDSWANSDDPQDTPDWLNDALFAYPVPKLPSSAQVDERDAQDSCQWLDSYVAFSRKWSPRSYGGFHEACGLWLLSVIAARRVVLHFGGPRYTSLYIALTGRTSLWAKTTAAKVGQATLKAAGLDWLLASDDASPQKFIADLTMPIPPDYDNLAGEAQVRALRRIAFGAQRGWFYEEFGQKIHAMLQPGGFMADFRGILRQFDDCPERYEYGTIGRGTDIVQAPYLALLANMTPADLRGAARRNDALWSDGFWARFALVTPPPGSNGSVARFPTDDRVIPVSLYNPLRQWHKRLGEPDVYLEDLLDPKGKPNGKKKPIIETLNTPPCAMEAGIADAFYNYHDGLLSLIQSGKNEDLDGSYARFAEKALRIAMLLASLENDGKIEARHWIKAQCITERWRRGLHSLYNQVNTAQPSEQAAMEEKIVNIVSKLGACTPTDVQHYVGRLATSEIVTILEGLADGGVLERESKTRKGTYRYKVMGDCE